MRVQLVFLLLIGGVTCLDDVSFVGDQRNPIGGMYRIETQLWRKLPFNRNDAMLRNTFLPRDEPVAKNEELPGDEPFTKNEELSDELVAKNAELLGEKLWQKTTDEQKQNYQRLTTTRDNQLLRDQPLLGMRENQLPRDQPLLEMGEQRSFAADDDIWMQQLSTNRATSKKTFYKIAHQEKVKSIPSGTKADIKRQDELLQNDKTIQNTDVLPLWSVIRLCLSYCDWMKLKNDYFPRQDNTQNRLTYNVTELSNDKTPQLLLYNDAALGVNPADSLKAATQPVDKDCVPLNRLLADLTWVKRIWNSDPIRLWGKQNWSISPHQIWGNRNWDTDTLRVCGKRNWDTDRFRGWEKKNWNTVTLNARRKRNWDTDTLRVWGKRNWDTDTLRVWGKRNWDTDTLRVWGKRNWDTDTLRVWGKRNWDTDTPRARGKRNWNSDPFLALGKRNWDTDPFRVWGKRG